MGANTRIYHRFTGYTLKDCDCRYCLYYGGKRKGCTILRCCCEKERSEAAAREKIGGNLFGNQNQPGDP